MRTDVAVRAVREVRRAAVIRRMCGDGRAMAFAGATRHRIRPRRTILFAPQRPLPPYVVYKLCALLGYRMETDPGRPHDVAFRFRDVTFDDATIPARAGVPVMNGALRDVSKARVQACWGAVAGYALAIDPTRHIGPAVCKGNRNAAHDGRVEACPVREVSPDHVYQRLVDNRSGPGMVMEHRVVIHGDTIPLVYLKYRPESARFVPVTNTRIEIADPAAVFTGAERATLLRFARAMGADVADMDVLRDAGDGRIYAVDVNSTPFGPPSGLPGGCKGRALRRLAETFRALVERSGPS